MYKTEYKGMTLICDDSTEEVEVRYKSGKEFGTFKSLEKARRAISSIKDWVPPTFSKREI